MPRYIDADALKDKYHDKMVELLKHTTSNMSEEALSLLCGCTLINAMQTADVIEVVRCKDCIVKEICRYKTGLGENGFCSQGERGEE